MTRFLREKGKVELYLLILAIFLGTFLVGGIPSFRTPTPDPNASRVAMQDRTQTKKDALQIDTPLVITHPPTLPPSILPTSLPPTGNITTGPTISLPNVSPTFNPFNPACGIAGTPEGVATSTFNGQCCVSDGAAHSDAECCPDVPVSHNFHISGSGQNPAGNTYAFWCDAKPVIYLYPTKKTQVTISVQIPGEIIVSNPDYPENGWKDIAAYPDGHFIYQKKEYHELFYETNQTKTALPLEGTTVKKEDLEKTLTSLVLSLGLNQTEKDELVTFWVKKLSSVSTPYIYLSYFHGKEKENLDHVTISPQPDTFIQFILYFKPVHAPIPAKPLSIPSIKPLRIGFTAVEWGGIFEAN